MNTSLIAWLGSVLTWAVLALTSVNLSAETAVLYPSKDNTIYEGNQFQNNSCGAGTGMIAGNTNNGLARRGLVLFDVASVIPPGATVTSVSVTMTVDRDRADAQSTALHAVLTDWGEGASDCDASAGQGIPAVAPDATWLAAMFPDTPWGAAGGDYSGAASATTQVTSGDSAVWASTPPLVNDVQGWVDGSANNGWIIIGNEAANQTAYRFGTRESANPPALIVEFTCPLGGCEPCCDAGIGSFVPPGTCAGFNPGGTTITPDTCVVDPGACCIPDADVNFTCQEFLPAECSAEGGTFNGAGTQCRDTNICGLAPWQDDLPSPAVLQPVGTRPDGVPQFEVSMTQFKQNLHSDLPDTTVWGYNGSFPGPTIAATVDQPVEIKYINDLRDFEGNLLDTHFLAVDQCAHGPNYWRDSPRTVVHLHGGHVPSRFDGQPEYDFMPGAFDTYEYPNNQLPATMWYHDHALGITRLNVIMGLAGFYPLSPDCSVTPNDPECNGTLPSGDYDVPIVIQDRDFNLNTGDFEYPDALQQAFHGNNILVNGKVWPTLKVDRGKYRFRILNGSTTRTYTLSFENITTGDILPITVIGTEGGFYAEPRPAPNNEVTLAPAERFEIIVDFEGQSKKDEIIIKNSAVTDFPGGNPPSGGTQNVLKLEVAGRGFTGPVPGTLRDFAPIIPAIATETRWFNLERVAEPCAGGEWLVQTLDGPNGNVIGEHWDDITEYPVLGGTEIWEFKNNSDLMHPMHVHLVLFQVLNRQALDANGNPTGPVLPPDPLEVNAWKETVQAKPGTVTRVIMTFEDYLGKFPYHCHIIEHEDHEMMRQFQVTNDPANCDNNGTCDADEDCISCAADCGSVPGNSCGNGLCEVGDGESAANCPGDCAPGCGVDGVGCADAACTPTGFFCRQTARVPACCGDSLCEGQETAISCAIDCAPAGQQCTYADPTVNISPTAQDITVDGGNVQYTVNIINNDSAACLPTMFNLTVDDSDNGADFVVPSTLSENPVTLGAAETGNVILTVTAQPGGTSSNDTSVIASDPANHADVTSNMVTTTINVGGGQVDCGQFTDRTSCKNEPTGSCRWINKDNICVNR